MKKVLVNYRDKTYDSRHGGAFDRGRADSYYGRPSNPHYYIGDTYSSDRVTVTKGSKAWNEYMAGYQYNEESGYKKSW